MRLRRHTSRLLEWEGKDGRPERIRCYSLSIISGLHFIGKTKEGEKQFFLSFFSLMNARSVFNEKTRKGERLLFDPSFP